MIHELLRAGLCWVVILPAAFLAGSCLGPLIRTADRLIRGILYFALGFAILSYGVVLLSAAKLLTPAAMWIMTGSFVVARCYKLRDCLAWCGDVARSFKPGRDFLSKLLGGIFLLSFVCLAMGALSPELGGDALCYQLNLPKVFLRQGSLAPNFFDYNSYFPLFMSNLYLMGLALGGVFAAKFFHFFLGFLLFLALRRLLEEETGNPGLAFFLALVLWLTPAVYNLLSTAYIDVALTLYTLLAVFSLIQALRSDDLRGFFLSGLLAGCGVAMKYLSLMTVIGLGVVWVGDLLVTRKFRSRLVGAGLFATGLLIVCGYWFLRNWQSTGNPFFPYWGEWFGLFHRPPTDHYLLGLGRSWFHFISLYFNMFLQPDSFGSWSTRIGIFYFLVYPFVFLAFAFVRKSREYGIFWLVFTLFIYRLAQADRWILPVLPVMLLAGGMGVQWCGTRFFASGSPVPKKVVSLLSIVLLSMYFFAGVIHYRYVYLLWAGQWSPQDYLVRMERTLPVADWINANLPDRSLILVESEPRLFYINRPVLRGVYLNWRYQNQKGVSLDDPVSLRQRLKSVGVTHILTSEVIGSGREAIVPTGIGTMTAAPEFAKHLLTIESRNIRDARYRYRVYELL